jgi:hypothetical protein
MSTIIFEAYVTSIFRVIRNQQEANSKQCYIAEDRTVHNHDYQDLESYMAFIVLLLLPDKFFLRFQFKSRLLLGLINC